MTANKKDLFCGFLATIIIIGALTIIPVMMIVYGVRNPTVSCVSPCVMHECDSPTNQPYILPTPSVGINVMQALIVGGALGIVLLSAFAIFAVIYCKDNFWTPFLLVPIIPFLAAVAWMFVSFVVYTQTIELCTKHNNLWSVDMTALKWLLGACIGGMIVLIGPYVIPYVLAGITAPCSNHKSPAQPRDCSTIICPCFSV